MSLKLSIIIPIYNAEKFLEKCVESVRKQTYENFELILVNDGSKDSSLEICKAYAEKDERVRVISQDNSGVSAARNNGIKAAKGEYIGFVDADDSIEPDMFEKLLSAAYAADADIVICDALTVYSDGRTEPDTLTQLSESKCIEKKDFTPDILLEAAGAVWRCIYKNELIKNNNIEFPYGIKFSEDRIFNILAMGFAEKISYLKEAYYNRIVNIESAVYSFHADYFEAYKAAAAETERAIARAWSNNESYQTAYLGQFISGAFGAICNYYYKTSTLSGKQRKAAVKSLCDDEQLRSAIKKYGADTKSQWILNKNYAMLITYAKLANLKHGR